MSTADTARAPSVAGGLHLAGVLARASAYAALAALVARYDCGRAILLGLVVGDLAASALAACWRWIDERTQALVELAVLGAAFLWIRHGVAWPVDLAERAILGLSAFGLFAGRTGGTALVRLGPSDD